MEDLFLKVLNLSISAAWVVLAVDPPALPYT